MFICPLLPLAVPKLFPINTPSDPPAAARALTPNTIFGLASEFVASNVGAELVSSITLPLASTAKLYVDVPVLVPEP